MAKKEKPAAKKTPKTYGYYRFTGLDGKKYRLTRLQKKFADIYIDEQEVSATQAVFRAGYKAKNVGSAKSIASNNLTKVDILAYIDKKLDDIGLNEQTANKHLLFLIRQNKSLSVKQSALKTYYEILGKIRGKIEVEAGEKLEGLLDKMSEVLNS